MEVDVVGGQFDGAVVGTAQLPEWGWVGPYGDGYRVYAASGGQRRFYRLAAPVAGSERVYLSAEHTHAVCGCCEVLTALADGCALCGSPLARA